MDYDKPAQPLHEFVGALAASMRRAKALSASEMAQRAGAWRARYPRVRPGENSPVCVIVAPHPDDECISGGLPLRLMLESGWRVIAIATTHGSNPARQLARAEEFRAACAHIGFEPMLLAERGLSRVARQAREADPEHWAISVTRLAEKLTALKPALVLCPHALDAQQTHIGTHHLTLDALTAISARTPDFQTTLAFTEYWSTMTQANLLLELTAAQVGDMISALACHVGEISRNPFHLTLPGWLIDNVRRGGEIVGTSGGEVPDFTFAAIYNVQQWRDGKLHAKWLGGHMLGRNAVCADYFA